jgi:hypothetical protein
MKMAIKDSKKGTRYLDPLRALRRWHLVFRSRSDPHEARLPSHSCPASSGVQQQWSISHRNCGYESNDQSMSRLLFFSTTEGKSDAEVVPGAAGGQAPSLLILRSFLSHGKS